MPSDNRGAVDTIYTQGFGLYGVRARIFLPEKVSAVGLDTMHYCSVYVGVFTDDPATTPLIEAGFMYFGESHIDKKKGMIGPAQFPHKWSVFVNPTEGGFKNEEGRGQREAVYHAPPRNVLVELVVSERDAARFTYNGHPFRPHDNVFSYGFNKVTGAKRGVSEQTFAKGFNMKACIGLNDIGGRGVRFSDTVIEIVQVLRKTRSTGHGAGERWERPTKLARSLPLMNAASMCVGPRLTVSYPAQGGFDGTVPAGSAQSALA